MMLFLFTGLTELTVFNSEQLEDECGSCFISGN